MIIKNLFHTVLEKRFPVIVIILIILMIISSSCNLPAEDEAGESVETEELVDPDAQPYRMYFDSAGNGADNELQIRTFTGQIRMADFEAIFGDTDELPQDEHGNYIGGPLLVDDVIWSLVVGPSLAGVNLVSRDIEDDTISSALDLDGNGIADIVDIWLGDGRRFTFVTEGLGMGVFEAWLGGENPLCNLAEFATFPGCEDNEEGGVGSAGGGAGVSPGGVYVSPLDQLCAEYNLSRPGLNRQVKGYLNSTKYSDNIYYGEDADQGRAYESTEIFTDSAGDHVVTIKYIYDINGEGDLIQTIVDVVYSDGVGTRTTTKPGRPPVTIPIEVILDSNGDYDAATDSFPPPVRPPIEPPPDEEPEPEPAPEGSDTSNPGPEGSDDFGLEDLCAQIASAISGVEQAAATDPTAFEVSCNDLVGAPASGDDCTIFEWARSGDFKGATEDSDNGCGPFEQPDEDGNCGPASGIQKLKGQVAEMASANLGGVVICPPIVCQDGLFDQLDLEEPDIEPQSGELPTESASTEAPTSGNSNKGILIALTLCNVGPGPGYKTVSSVKAGVEVQILGLGSEAGWMVIDNPIYSGEACWIPVEYIKVPPELDLTSLPVFQIPSLPDKGGDDACTLTQADCSGNMIFDSAKCQCVP